MARIRIALAQLNTTVGDISGNSAKVRESLARARDAGAGIVVFPELTLCGYPPEDLLLRARFAAANRAALEALAPDTAGLTAVVGFVDRQVDLFNAAAVLHDGEIAGVYHKRLLPNYSVFDEDRYFAQGETRTLFHLGATASGPGVRFGVSICEDIWYPSGPPESQATAGADLLVVLSASPYQSGKIRARERMLATRAVDNVAAIAFCNLVGGQDELVFDGGSVVMDERGEVLARARPFAEDLVTADIDTRNVFRQRLRDPRHRKNSRLVDADGFHEVTLGDPGPIPIPGGGVPEVHTLPDSVEAVYRALVLATRDYVGKNGFSKVVLGLSGGVDSALVAAIAVDALGSDNVVGVSMPSEYSSDHSVDDAEELSRLLGTELRTVSIRPAHTAYREMLAETFEGVSTGTADENLQSRARGNVLMALSNAFGWLVLTTGNKSEMAVGYATMYGDMAGGFAVIKDVPKLLVYELCRWRNEHPDLAIPERILTKPPSAELRPNQFDTDSLPDYDVLDPILEAYVEREYGPAEIIEMGFDEATVRRVTWMVDLNEYKRRQAPPGPKVTSKAFGKDRRLPITNRFVAE